MHSENISTPTYVECDKRYRSKVCAQEFWYIVSVALIFNLKNLRTTILYAEVAALQVAKDNKSYSVFFSLLIRTYGLVVKVSHRESGDLGSIPDGC